MSASIINDLTGNAASPENFVIVEPSHLTGQGGSTSVLAASDTQRIISPNAVCKYVNIRQQMGTGEGNTNGWLEYAVVLFTERETPPDNSGFSNLNTQTLGDIAINKFRGKCIWNGAVPINQDQAKVLDLQIKMPSKWCKWQRGTFLLLYQYWRPSNVLDNTNLNIITSTQWKAYL